MQSLPGSKSQQLIRSHVSMDGTLCSCIPLDNLPAGLLLMKFPRCKHIVQCLRQLLGVDIAMMCTGVGLALLGGDGEEAGAGPASSEGGSDDQPALSSLLSPSHMPEVRHF